MNKLFFLFIIIPFFSFAQPEKRLSGYVEDAKTGERLIGATLYHPTSGIGTVTNNYGFFSLVLPVGSQSVDVRFVGYRYLSAKLDIQKDTLLVFRLNPGVDLGEVTVKGQDKSQVDPELSTLSFNRINIGEIDRMPVILGERDLLKSLQYLPGIKGGRENTATYNVRGGSSDQNLILLDGVPVYNVYHVFGFFSVFNNDAIKNANLYKGGIPARYGGRLSSVLDISMKDGNMKKGSGVFSISPISARLTIEAPIKKDTASYLLSFRRTLLDLPMVLSQKANGSNQTYSYKFYDFNGKANWIINPNNRVYLSLYAGRDKQFHRSKEDGAKSTFFYKWGNYTSVLRWNKVFSSKLFTNFSVYGSHFFHSQEGETKDKEIDLHSYFTASSTLTDLSLKADAEYYISPLLLFRFGANYSHMNFKPNIIQIKSTEDYVRLNDEFKRSSNLLEAYVENQIRAGGFNFNLGGRFSNYTSGSASYNYLQPRLAIKYQTNNDFSISASYMRMFQYLHLLTNSSLGMPTDLWVAATDKIKPQKGEQLSFGFEQGLNNGYKFGAEAYYKWMNQVVRFDEGETFLNSNDDNWEENILEGKGKAYGAEFYLKKEEGRFRGMVSYTWAKSERLFDEVNNGRWFPFKYDRRHDLSFFAEYDLGEKYNRKKNLSIGFTLQSGNNLSIADTEMKGLIPPGMENYAHPDLPEWFTTRKTFYNPNNYKMPTFHHLDIGYTTKLNRSTGKSYSWTFSLYNIYNRMNPWYYYKKDDQVRSVSIFPIIPSVSFTYRW